ncbi:MAG: peptidoglycan-binding domain-containing protein [Bryobacteraceae bacterium]
MADHPLPDSEADAGRYNSKLNLRIELMKRILIASLFSAWFGVCAVFAVAATADTGKKTTSTSTTHSTAKTAAKTSTGAKSGSAAASSAKKPVTSTAKKSTTSAKAGTVPAKTTSSASTKTVHASSKHGAKPQVAKARRPSYQTAPSPERYQQIQQSLADRGFYKGEVNGVWGAESQDAMKRYQESQNLPDDGKITAKALIGLGLGPNHGGPPGATQPATNQPGATQPGTNVPSPPAAATPAPSASPATPTPDPPQPTPPSVTSRR